MRRYLILVLAAGLALTGCASAQTEDPFKVDTVVVIPVDPTDSPTEEPTERPTEGSTGQLSMEPTEVIIQAVPQLPAVPEPTKPKETVSSSKTSGKASGKGSSSNTQKPKATEPPATEPPMEESPVTEPPATNPLVVNPPAIEIMPPAEAPTEPPYDPASYNIGDMEHVMLDMLNVHRLDIGIGALSMGSKASGVAYLRAQEAADSWSHTRPDGRGFDSVLSDYGYPYNDVAELMVYTTGNCDPAAMVTKWMNAKAHRAEILNTGFSEAGIGIYRTGGMTYVVCLLIG